jgi:6-pyruvoyltetrahydropterin/6-carboxytetrahydropterin synthase
VDDPSFAFDYAHILPTTRKCSVLHGHTSAVLIEIVGRPVDGMIVDFGEVKRLVRKALTALDHKLFIARRYLADDRNGQYRIRFESPHGQFDLSVPKETTYLLEEQATVENLAREVVRLVLPRMPGNVEALGAYVYEGLNKGSHLLAAALHRGRS